MTMMKKSSGAVIYGTVSVLFSLLICLGPARAGEYQLSTQLWNVPRSAETVLAMPPLQKTMQELREQAQAHLMILFPGGDEGTLWAHELRAWLISLGLASEKIELVPGSPDPQTIQLRVIVPHKLIK